LRTLDFSICCSSVKEKFMIHSFHGRGEMCPSTPYVPHSWGKMSNAEGLRPSARPSHVGANFMFARGLVPDDADTDHVDRWDAAHVVGQADLGVLDLPRAGFPL